MSVSPLGGSMFTVRLWGFITSVSCLQSRKSVRDRGQNLESSARSEVCMQIPQSFTVNWSGADDASSSVDVMTPSGLCTKPSDPHCTLQTGDTPQSASIMTPSGKFRTQRHRKIVPFNLELHVYFYTDSFGRHRHINEECSFLNFSLSEVLLISNVSRARLVFLLALLQNLEQTPSQFWK